MDTTLETGGIEEVEVLTQTKRQWLERLKTRRCTVSKVYAMDTINSSARVYRECGAQAMLVFRAVLGSYLATQAPDEGYTVPDAFVKATELGPRQFRRGITALEEAGYLEATKGPGRKSRIMLTAKGKQCLVNSKCSKFKNGD